MPGLISLRRAAGFFQSDNRNRSISSPGCCYARVLLGLANLVAELGPEISVLQGTQQRAVHGAGVAAWDESSVIATQGGYDRLIACRNQRSTLRSTRRSTLWPQASP